MTVTIISALPVTLTNGTTADASQVMQDLNQIVNNVNANAVAVGSTLTVGNLAYADTANSIRTSGIVVSGSTITTGTWNGTTIGVAYGGTGQSSYTDGQLLIGNTSTGLLSKATLTA